MVAFFPPDYFRLLREDAAGDASGQRLSQARNALLRGVVTHYGAW